MQFFKFNYSGGDSMYLASLAEVKEHAQNMLECGSSLDATFVVKIDVPTTKENILSILNGERFEKTVGISEWKVTRKVILEKQTIGDES